MFEAVFRGAARASRNDLSIEDRAQVDHLIRLIELTPYIDGVFKAPFVVAPLVLVAFENGSWRIVYRIVESFVEIYSIRRLP